MMIKGLSHQESSHTYVFMYLLTSPKVFKAKISNYKEKDANPWSKWGVFTHIVVTDRMSRWKISEEIEDLDSTKNGLGEHLERCLRCWRIHILFKRYTKQPGRRDTTIMKVVFPGLGLSIAFQMCWRLWFSQMWETGLHNLW